MRLRPPVKRKAWRAAVGGGAAAAPSRAQLEAETLGAGPHRAVRVHEERERWRGPIATAAVAGWRRALARRERAG
eukprot:scaffold41935_cov75-Phaeocystis_antarctica.AAC.1